MKLLVLPTNEIKTQKSNNLKKKSQFDSLFNINFKKCIIAIKELTIKIAVGIDSISNLKSINLENFRRGILRLDKMVCQMN